MRCYLYIQKINIMKEGLDHSFNYKARERRAAKDRLSVWFKWRVAQKQEPPSQILLNRK